MSHPRNPWLALAALAAGLSMIVLDGTIVGVALPTIISRLHLDLTQAQWVNSLYSVVFAALLLTAGRLGDLLGRRTTFLAGTAAFMAGSVMAATAGDATWLVWARAVQGVGGALVLPATLSSVNSLFQGKDRAAAFGVWGAVMSGMAALGPLLGGLLTEHASWRWIFWVNIPFGLLVLAATVAWVPQTRGLERRKGFDVDGLLTSGLGFGALVFALIEGQQLGWWHAKDATMLSRMGWHWTLSPVPLLVVAGLLLVALFVLWERHRARNGRDALLDLTLFRVSTFGWGNLTAGAVAVGEFALMLVLPLQLVNVVGLSTMTTGLVLAGMALGAFFSGAGARHLAARLGAPSVVVLGLALEVAGVLGLATVVQHQGATWLVTVLLVLYGLGLGLASAQLTSTVLADIDPALSGQGSATQSTVRQLGSAVGSAVAGTLLSVGLVHRIPAALHGLPGIPAGQAGRVADAVQSSGGGVIAVWRSAGTSSPFGPQTGRVTDALATGFSQAATWSILGAGAFLLLGLLGALQVRRAALRTA